MFGKYYFTLKVGEKPLNITMYIPPDIIQSYPCNNHLKKNEKFNLNIQNTESTKT